MGRGGGGLEFHRNPVRIADTILSESYNSVCSVWGDDWCNSGFASDLFGFCDEIYVSTPWCTRMFGFSHEKSSNPVYFWACNLVPVCLLSRYAYLMIFYSYVCCLLCMTVWSLCIFPAWILYCHGSLILYEAYVWILHWNVCLVSLFWRPIRTRMKCLFGLSNKMSFRVLQWKVFIDNLDSLRECCLDYQLGFLFRLSKKRTILRCCFVSLIKCTLVYSNSTVHQYRVPSWQEHFYPL